MPQRVDDGVYRSTVAAWKLAAPATVQERRAMKKVAQPEHAYTGYVLRWTEDAPPEPEKRRNAPILGYKGHLRHAEDCIGTTFTRGVEIAARPGVLTASDIARRGSHLALTSAKDPRVKMQQGRPGSGYGEFAGASGYGEFASPGSGYGAFDNASGYGAFQAPPVRPTGADATSSYGAFDGASGYGAFQVPPNGTSGSGYGAFDGASGYGAFQSAPESPKDMATPRYGMFDGASAYGDFAVPPKSARGGSGYGEFDGASGYGQFLDAPSNQDHATEPPRDRRHQIHSPRRGFPDGSMTGMRYTQAIRACGGEHAVKRLWQVAAHTISQRYMKRTELLQAVKRSFEKHEQENGGRMTKEHLKEALQSLSCVLTDDQVTALFGTYDARCSGTVPMDTLLVALTDHLVS